MRSPKLQMPVHWWKGMQPIVSLCLCSLLRQEVIGKHLRAFPQTEFSSHFIIWRLRAMLSALCQKAIVLSYTNEFWSNFINVPVISKDESLVKVGADLKPADGMKVLKITWMNFKQAVRAAVNTTNDSYVAGALNSFRWLMNNSRPQGAANAQWNHRIKKLLLKKLEG